MLLSALLEAAKIEYHGADCEISEIVCDSRRAHGGTAFVCISGFAADGHAYAKKAYEGGCRVFVAERELSLLPDASVILVNDTREAVADLAAAFYGYPSKRLCVVGITGTKGKTTTALMLASVLDKNGISAGYIGSNGIEYGGMHFETKNTTPDSLELCRVLCDMANAGVKAAVIEVSSQAIYLNRVRGISFFATAFTNLAPDHIGGSEHPTFEHYRDSKKRLFDEYPSRFTVYNQEDEAGKYMVEGAHGERISFGLQGGDLHADGIRRFMENGLLGTAFDAHFKGEVQEIKLPMPGDFSVQNALCAAALASCFGISLAQSAAALCDTLVKGRFEIVKTPLDAVFVIDYAHNGFSLESALKTLKSYSPQRLWCVVGSVGGRTTGRRAELGEAASIYCDRVLLTADNPDFEDVAGICAEMKGAFVRDTECRIFEDREDAVRYAVENVKKGDIVLFAGKGHENYQLVRGEKLPFCERELILKYAMEAAAELV